jgi:hypothetical protein
MRYQNQKKNERDNIVKDLILLSEIFSEKQKRCYIQQGSLYILCQALIKSQKQLERHVAFQILETLIARRRIIFIVYSNNYNTMNVLKHHFVN